MPRQARLDAPGVLHQVMARGIAGSNLFHRRKDREDFLSRLEALAREQAWVVYAWVLMPNHFHLLVRTGKQPLAWSMRRLMTGYVVNFNRRHQRHGLLFQNRYKSIVCAEEPYLLELTRYIHLNPLRGGVVPDLDKLGEYAWSGHAALLGNVQREWQDTETILSRFGRRTQKARAGYERFVAEGAPLGRRPELVGGGLIRSVGGWSQVLSLRRQGLRLVSDERILGGGEFIAGVLSQAEDRLRETLRLRTGKIDLKTLASRVSRSEKMAWATVVSGGQFRQVVRVRRLFCQLAVKKFRYSGAEVARFIGTATSSVTRLANSPELPEVHRPEYAL